MSTSQSSRIEKEADCLNCGAEMVGRFCAQCGQDSARTLKPMAISCREFLEDLGALEFRVVSTLNKLLLVPGQATAEVLAGKRQAFTPALRLYVVCSAVAIAMMSVVGLVSFDSIFRDLSGEQIQQLESVLGAGSLNDPALMERFDRRFNTLFPIFNLLTPIGLCLSLKLVIRRILLQAHAIAALHLSTALVVYSMVLIPASLLGERVALVVVLLLCLGLLAYVWIFLRRVYPASRPATGFRVAALSLTYFVLASVITTATLAAVFATM